MNKYQQDKDTFGSNNEGKYVLGSGLIIIGYTLILLGIGFIIGLCLT